MRGLFQRLRRHILIFLAVLGPGFITAVVDNDSGGIYTYSQAGARWLYLPLWTLLPITVALIVTQEMCSRMGAVTGKGLSDLIREEFGLRTTFLIMILLVLANLTNIMAEFAGVATALGLFGITAYVSVPIAAVAVWFLAVKGNYRSVEKVFLFACVIYVSYIVAGILVKPDWKQAMIYSVRPKLMLDSGYITMLIAMVGTTIAPWMQFYLQAAVVEKGITAKEYRQSRVEVIVGCFMTSVIAFFIIVACAGAYRDHPTDITDAAQAALALKPFSQWATPLFSAGLLNASVFAACILPLSTAYSVCEGLGFESGVSKRWREAPIFYWLYTLLIAVGAGVVILPNFPLVKMILLSQVLNGMLLPFILIFMIILINKKGLMKEWINPPAYNAVAWTTVIIVIGMTLALTGITIFETPEENLDLLDEQQFRMKSDEALTRLERALEKAAAQYEFDVDRSEGALTVEFDDPPARFVVSPNSPVRQVWVSARVQSFKLDWSDTAGDFVLAPDGRNLRQLLGDVIGQQLGEPVSL